MSPDCDLDWDFKARQQIVAQGQAAQPNDASKLPLGKLMYHALFCDLVARKTVHIYGPPNATLWEKLEQNGDTRYHHLEPAAIGEPASARLDDQYMDFKKIFGLPIDRVYEGLQSGQITRIALIPSVYVQNLMHRFFHFQSRVALPD